jgi:flagellar P-ring protein precursor FlgI
MTERTPHMPSRVQRIVIAAVLLAAALLLPTDAQAQGEVKIRDLTNPEGAMPMRLVGYGLVVGLDGTGDRAVGGQTAGQTVQSVINILRRFNIEVPADLIRMRNVAAVLVTAEVSPFLRAGGRFEVHVSSMGDAKSLRGGVLYMTPLVGDASGPSLASAQGTLLVSEGGSSMRYAPTIETSARIPAGGVLEADLARPVVAATSRLLLREPDLGTATRIVTAINTAFGDRTAMVEDEGSVVVTFPDTVVRPTAYARIRELSITPERAPRLVIDGKERWLPAATCWWVPPP